MTTVAAFKVELREKYFECPVCKRNLKDPTLLPCLHRCCRECVHKVVSAANKGPFTCPICKRVCAILGSGASGFKTDFHTKTLLQFNQLQQTFDDKAEKKCTFCSKTKLAGGYCFKCKDYLCEECCPIHLTSNMFTDHQPHLLDPKKIGSKDFTLQMLMSLTEDPKCHDHSEQRAQLCCASCGNLPICVTCVYGKHREHGLQDVNEIAKTERESANRMQGELDAFKDRIYELQRMVETAKRTLSANVEEKRDKLVSQHRHQVEEIEKKVKENEARFSRIQAKIDEDDEADRLRVEKEFDERIRRINLERAEVLRETKKAQEKRRMRNQEELDGVLGDLNKKREALDLNLKELEGIISRQTARNEQGIKEIEDHTDHTIDRYENLKETTSTILASSHHWNEARCLPDIRAAAVLLKEDMRKEYPELKSLDDVTVRDLPSVFDVRVTVTEQAESVVEIAALKDGEWRAWSMTSSGDGHIVVSGTASDEYSFIAVVNERGEELRQNKIEKERRSRWNPARHCDKLSRYKIATLCESGQLDKYDVRNGAFSKNSISDVISSWSSDRYVSCIATDPVTKNIFVGSKSSKSHGDVLVYDDNLSYRHTLTLPRMVRGSRDITVHDGHLVVCDKEGKGAYVLTMQKREATMVYALDKPDDDGVDWYPIRVCTDSHDYIYMLWEASFANELRVVLTQYSPDGRRLLTTMPVDADAVALCTCLTDAGEKLLIATWSERKLYRFGLNY